MKANRSQKQKVACGGFTLVEIMIVVAIIGLLAAIAIPNFVTARTVSQRRGCIENLRHIFYAKASWAMETKKSSGATPVDSDLFGNTLYIRDKPACPANGVYTLRAMDIYPLCTIAGHTL